MSALIARPKAPIDDVSLGELDKLKAQARRRGCDAVLVWLKAAAGCEVTVMYSEVTG